MNRKRRATVLACALALALVCAGAAWAAGGDESDPLVTVSYLEQTALPDLLEKVEEQTATRQAELEKSLSDQIDQYRQELEGAGGDGGSASYTLVTLSSGQTLYLNVGCEVLLRIGTLRVDAPEDPALIDLSAGTTLSRGSSLTTNHLYMSTIAGRTLTPTSGTVKVLLRGSYSVG